MAFASRAKQWVDLLDEGRVSLNLAHPPSGGTIPVNTEFAILRSPPDRLRSLLLHPGSDAVVYPSVIALDAPTSPGGHLWVIDPPGER